MGPWATGRACASSPTPRSCTGCRPRSDWTAPRGNDFPGRCSRDIRGRATHGTKLRLVLTTHHEPEWFSHRRYAIVFVDGKELRGWFGRAAPRKGGKYRLDPDQIVDLANYPPNLADSIYYPSVL